MGPKWNCGYKSPFKPWSAGGKGFFGVYRWLQSKWVSSLRLGSEPLTLQASLTLMIYMFLTASLLVCTQLGSLSPHSWLGLWNSWRIVRPHLPGFTCKNCLGKHHLKNWGSVRAAASLEKGPNVLELSGHSQDSSKEASVRSVFLGKQNPSL